MVNKSKRLNPKSISGFLFAQNLVHLLIKPNKIIVMLTASVILSGCMLTSKMDKIVTDYYAQKKIPLRIIEPGSNSIIITDSLKRVNGYCKSEYKHFFTIPLLVYFYSNEKINCRINPKIYANSIITELNNRLSNDGLGKLRGKTLEIVFKTIPTSFYHRYTDSYITVQYWFSSGFSSSKDEAFLENGMLRINYILRDSVTRAPIKTGKLEENFAEMNWQKQYNENRKSFIRSFVSTFDENMQSSCKQIVQTLINQLD